MVPINMRTEKPYKMPSSAVEIILAVSSGTPAESMARIIWMIGNYGTRAIRGPHFIYI
jgi:hypothetical protein